MIKSLTYSLILALSLFFVGFSKAQNYSIQLLDESLLRNADAVVRRSEITIEISTYNAMREKKRRVVTVLNAEGEKHINAYTFYDPTTKIKKLYATVYDKSGKEIKSFKKNDFIDVNAVDGVSMYTDYRVKYLDYTGISYPYTIAFNSEVETTTTAFIPSWLPLEDYRVSTAYAKYELINTSGIPLKTKKTHFESYAIDEDSPLVLVAKNLTAIKEEPLSVGFKNRVPYMRVALEVFDMKGVKGTNKNWNDFGKWVHDTLNNDTRTLPQEVIVELKARIPESATDLEKVKIIYQYMQNKTRYVAVHMGIGGWRPIVAEKVNRMGYGDCKGLSNYTKALLEAVGVSAHYAIIFGGRSIRSLDRDFSATQGNHAVLAVPHKEDYIWLECTSQTNPFGYIANFTDDRDALLITPDGGKIVRTKAYKPSENKAHVEATVELTQEGAISGSLTMITEGARYDFHASIEDKPLRDQKLVYKETYWGDINLLNIASITLSNDKENVRFTEHIEFSASNYGKISGGRLMFSPNIFNKLRYIPPKNKNRLSPLKIDRGSTDIDDYLLEIPDSTVVEVLPKPVEISSDFGTYSYHVVQEENNLIRIKRILVFYNGLFDAERYDDYRNFRKSISKADQSKIILTMN